MPRQRTVLLATLASAVLVAGCSSLFQQNIKPDDPALFEPGEGLILGSVTAPLLGRHHEIIRFHYRSVGDGGKTAGHVTSAAKFWPPWGIPTCDKEGLAEQCGRLFAVSLPAGSYEVYGVQEVRPSGKIFEMPPLQFTVSPGRASYLGNMHTTFCQGLAYSVQGAILGGHLVILDESQRDLSLLESRYPQLKGADIEMQLLPNLGWRWRTAYEPYDWGSCESGTGQAEPARRNSVYFEGLGNGGRFSINYERLLSDRLGLRLGYGTSGDTTGDGRPRATTVPIMLNALYGSGRRQFELGGGVVVGSNESTGFQTLTGTIGLRWHGRSWLLRAGITPFYGLNDESSSYPKKGFHTTGGFSFGLRF